MVESRTLDMKLGMKHAKKNQQSKFDVHENVEWSPLTIHIVRRQKDLDRWQLATTIAFAWQWAPNRRHQQSRKVEGRVLSLCQVSGMLDFASLAPTDSGECQWLRFFCSCQHHLRHQLVFEAGQHGLFKYADISQMRWHRFDGSSRLVQRYFNLRL